MLVSSDDRGPLESDPRIHPIAEITDLHQPVGELADTKLAWIEKVTEARKVANVGLVRDVIRRLGQQLEPDFDEDAYWAR